MPWNSSLECRVCTNSPLEYVKLVHGEHRHDDVPLYRCRSCRSHFSVPKKFAGSDEISRFNIVQWHLLAAEYNVRKVNALLRIVDERGWAGKAHRRFLDVGCGIGTTLRTAMGLRGSRT